MASITRFASLVGVLAIAAASLVGCEKTAEDEQTALPNRTGTETQPVATVTFNTNCPMMPENEVKASVETVEYNGHTIGFCCEECIDSWNAWTDEKKAEFIAASEKVEEGLDDLTDGDN